MSLLCDYSDSSSSDDDEQQVPQQQQQPHKAPQQQGVRCVMRSYAFRCSFLFICYHPLHLFCFVLTRAYHRRRSFSRRTRV